MALSISHLLRGFPKSIISWITGLDDRVYHVELYFPLHGVLTSSTLSISSSTITVNDYITYWYNGTQVINTSSVSCNIADTGSRHNTTNTLTDNTLYFIYFNDTSSNLVWSDTFWNLKTTVPVATVYWNGSAGALSYLMHGYLRDVDWHINAHLTIGCRYYNGLLTTKPNVDADNILDITAGTIYDLDIAFHIPQTDNARIWYLTGSKYTWTTSIYPYGHASNSTLPAYANGTTLVPCPSNRFVSQWVYGTTDLDYPIYIIPQNSNEPGLALTITLARNTTPPALTGLGLTPEMKLLYRYIYKGAQFQLLTDYRTVSSLPNGFIASTNASSVTVVPYNNISSTNVQSAIQLLDYEKYNVNQSGSAVQTITGSITNTGNIVSSGTITGLPIGLLATLGGSETTVLGDAEAYVALYGSFSVIIEQSFLITADHGTSAFVCTYADARQYYKVDWHITVESGIGDVVLVGLMINGNIARLSVMSTSAPKGRWHLSGTFVFRMGENDYVQIGIASSQRHDLITVHNLIVSINEFYD